MPRHLLIITASSSLAKCILAFSGFNVTVLRGARNTLTYNNNFNMHFCVYLAFLTFVVNFVCLFVYFLKNRLQKNLKE